MSKDRRKGWLRELKEGDDVIICSGDWRSRDIVARVGSITCEGIIDVYDPSRPEFTCLFNHVGWEHDRADNYNVKKLMPADEESIAEIVRCKRIESLRGFESWEDLTDEDLSQTVAIIERYPEEK